MADFEKTNYEDFLLSNFRSLPQNDNEEAKVEVLQNDYDINGEGEQIDLQIDKQQNIPIVKTDLVLKKIEEEKFPPQTLAVVLKATNKCKALKQEDKNCKKDNKKSSQKRKRSKPKNFLLVVMVVIMAFVSCLLIADAFTNGYILDTAIKKMFKTDTSKEYYAVEIASFSDVDSARITSEEIRASGGSGYVLFDKVYRVIAEVYSEIKQAESVSAKLNLAGYVTSVYTIKIEEVNYSLFPMSTRNLTKDVLGYQKIMYDTLYSVGQRLENNEIDFQGARSEVKSLKTQISNILVEYESNVDNQIDNKYVIKVRMQISSMIGALDNICGESSKNDRLLSDIRYINTLILNTHRSLVNSLQSNDK